MKSSFDSKSIIIDNFGDSTRDNFLQHQINNDVASQIEIEETETENIAKLKSATGKVLSTAGFPKSQGKIYTGTDSETISVNVDNETDTISADYIGPEPESYTGGTTDTVEVLIDSNNEIKANYIGAQPKVYTGETTETIELTVDNQNNTISANYIGSQGETYTGGTTNTIEVSIDENNEITANYIGQEPKVYTGDTTSSIQVSVNNNTNKISANYIKKPTNDFHPLNKDDTIKKIQFDLSLDIDTVFEIVHEIVGDIPEYQSRVEYPILYTQIDGQSSPLLTFAASHGQQSGIDFVLYTLLVNNDSGGQAIWGFVDCEEPIDPDWPHPQGFDPYRDVLDPNGVLVLSEVFSFDQATIDKLSENEDDEKDSLWNNILITGVSDNTNQNYLNVFNGTEELKTNIELKNVLLAVPQTLTTEQQQTILTNLGLIDARDLEY